MIPKNVITCWFGPGKPRPEIEGVCENARNKYFPKERWNHIHITEKEFDVNKYEYTKKAYEMGLYAMVADFVRTWALLTYGGIYVDTDELMIKEIDDEILNNEAFIGSCMMPNNNVTTYGDWTSWGLFGAEKDSKFLQELYSKFFDKDNIEQMNIRHFCMMPETRRCLKSNGLTKEMLLNIDKPVKGTHITVYPFDYFTCLFWNHNEEMITDRSYGIQLYGSSWQTRGYKQKAYKRILNFFSKSN